MTGTVAMGIQIIFRFIVWGIERQNWYKNLASPYAF
jgi:hypothetical protein